MVFECTDRYRLYPHVQRFLYEGLSNATCYFVGDRSSATATHAGFWIYRLSFTLGSDCLFCDTNWNRNSACSTHRWRLDCYLAARLERSYRIDAHKIVCFTCG